jgi:hypothetical protein
MFWITKYSKSGTKLLVNYLDRDTMLAQKEYVFNNNYVKLLNNETVELYFEWAHNEPIQETLLDKSNVLTLMNKNNWNLDYEYKSSSVKLNGLYIWQIYVKS